MKTLFDDPEDGHRRTIDVPPLSVRAAVESFDEKARTIDLVFSTGADVERVDWWSGKRYIERLSLDPAHVRLDRLNAGGPLLDSHSAWSVSDQLGAVVPGTAVLAKNEARATVRFSKRESVDEVWRDVVDGIIRSVSVGYRVYRFDETAGKNNTLPVRTATDWEPFEISMVPIPADAGAHTRGDRPANSNACVIVTRDSAKEMTMPETKPETAKASEAEPEKTSAAAPPPSTDAVRAEAARDERERGTAIRALVKRHGLGDDLAEDLVGKGTSLDESRRIILDKLIGISDKVETDGHVRVCEDAADKYRMGAVAWLVQRAGTAELLRAAGKAKPDHGAFRGLSLDPGEFRGMSLVDMAREALERAGTSTRGMDRQALVGRAFQTTSDFTVALETALHKTLLAAYSITPDTWRRFCAVGSVADFRAHNRYRTGYLGRLDQVLEHGEFTNKALPDATKETITATTKGNILALSRQAIVNDDMDVFSRVAVQVGRAAALSIELDVYDLIKLNAGLGPAMNDAVALFDATHDNLGAGAAISVESIDADRVVLASQTDPSGNEVLALTPAILLLPIGLGGTARVINDAQYDPDTVNKLQRPNKVRGLFRDIVDTPHLTGTRRYMFADPALMPVIEVAFLEGVQEPFLEMSEGWRIDGTEWKVRLDYGVAAIEYRGAVTNAGV